MFKRGEGSLEGGGDAPAERSGALYSVVVSIIIDIMIKNVLMSVIIDTEPLRHEYYQPRPAHPGNPA